MIKWEKMLDFVIKTVSPQAAVEDLEGFLEQSDGDPDLAAVALAGFLAEFFVESAGLFAATNLPAEEALPALAEIETALHNLDLESGRDELEPSQRELYDTFANFVQPLYPRMGTAMRALFTVYVTSDYDAQADPDLLIQKALQVEDEDETKGRHLITQAGAIALHSTFPWWRWPQEADGPLAPWLRDIFLLINDFTNQGQTPLGPIAEARAEMQRTIEKVEPAGEEVEKSEPVPPKTSSPVDRLIQDIIESGEGPTDPEWVERARSLGEEAAYALIGLAGDEELSMMDAPGEGYGPIHAVHILGQLQVADAAATLIDLVYDSDPLDIIYSAALHALQQIGPPALEPILQCLHYSQDIESTVSLCEALADIGQVDERAFETLMDLWNKTSWDQGKVLIASAFGQLGDPRALPLLQAAQRDPAVGGLDRNELDYAIEQLAASGGEAHLLASLKLHQELDRVSDPDAFHHFVQQEPPDWRTNDESTSHGYTNVIETRLLGLTLELLSTSETEEIIQELTQLIQALDELSFDADPLEMTPEVRAGYTHLRECAGPYLKWHCLGMWLTFLHYARNDYDLDLDPTPDELLFSLRDEMALDDNARTIVGRAGALALRGQPLWSLWPSQMEKEISAAVNRILTLHKTLKRIQSFPFSPVDQLGLQLQKIQKLDLSDGTIAPTLKDLTSKLFQIRPGTDRPRNALLRQFKKHRADAIPQLIHLLETPWYWSDEAPGEGWSPILAARLLGYLEATEAADALVSAIVHSGWDAIIRDAAIVSLINLGQPALPAVHTFFCYGRQDEGRVALAEVLGRIGRNNAASFDLLAELWERVEWSEYKRLVAVAFGALSDRRAIPLLQTGIEDRQTDVLDRDYAAWALATLEGQPPPRATELSGWDRNRPKLPQLHRPRLIVDEQDRYALPSFTVWGEMLCPDCGALLVRDINGIWSHPVKQSKNITTAPRSPKKRRRKRGKRKRR